MYVDNFVFGDPCPGVKKELGVEVVCGAKPGPPPPPTTAARPAYRLDVTIPVGVRQLRHFFVNSSVQFRSSACISSLPPHTPRWVRPRDFGRAPHGCCVLHATLCHSNHP